MKLVRIIQSVEALKTLADFDLSVNAAYKIKKVMKAIEPVVDTFNEREKALLEKHGEVNEEGTQYTFPLPGSAHEYQFARQEVLEEEIDFEVETLDPSELGDIKIKPNLLFLLDWFIDITEED